MRRLVWAWVAGTVVHVVSLVVGAVLVGLWAERAEGSVAAWPLLVVPGVLAGTVAVLVATARSTQRPARLRGVAAVAAPALVALGLSVAGSVAAAAYADQPALVRVLDVTVPPLVLVLTGLLVGLVRHVRWAPSTRSSYAEVV